ncbi:MAG: NTP transferase domain-containing protein [Bacteroidales bacterium]|nr:NTP transferase domain-containing protein [Bacteroidales bacterium]
MKSAFIFAAGLGTRLKPLTDRMPKALVPYGGTPLLEQTIENLKRQGFDRFVINIHHFAQMIRDFVAQHNSFDTKIEFSDESDLLRDTGGAIKHAAHLLSEGPFLIHNVDIISNLDLNALYNTHLEDRQRPLATLLVSSRETSRYFLFDGDNRLVGWINKSTGQVKSPFEEIAKQSVEQLTEQYRPLAFGGMHVISPEIFPLMAEPRWGEKFSVIDFYLWAAKEHLIRGYEAPAGTTLTDVGKLDQIGAIAPANT